MLRAGAKRIHVGDYLGREVFNSIPRADLFDPRKRIITATSPEFATRWITEFSRANVFYTWPSANDPIALPFALSEDVTVVEFGWLNATAADSVDIGIYDTAWNRLVSGGGTACAGNNTWQWVNVTDTVIPRGRYYLAVVKNGVTGNSLRGYTQLASTTILALAGVQDSATDAYPLPNPLTNMADASVHVRVPQVAIATRVHF